MPGPFQAIWGRDVGSKRRLPAWKGCLNQSDCCSINLTAAQGLLQLLLRSSCAAPAAKRLKQLEWLQAAPSM